MRKLFFLITLIICSSCSKTKRDTDYNKFTASINPIVFKNLPLMENEINQSSALLINYAEAYEYIGFASFYAVYSYNEEEFNEKKMYLEKHKLAIYNVGDKCNFLIPKEQETTCKSKNLPVPSLTDELNALDTYVGLDSKYYVLNYRSQGNYFRNNKVKGNGYSSGAILDEEKKVIIYWVIIL